MGERDREREKSMKRDGLAATVVQFQGLKGRGKGGGVRREKERDRGREIERYKDIVLRSFYETSFIERLTIPAKI